MHVVDEREQLLLRCVHVQQYVLLDYFEKLDGQEVLLYIGQVRVLLEERLQVRETGVFGGGRSDGEEP